jgi:CPA1 family monovalent cation:H+ antiporter
VLQGVTLAPLIRALGLAGAAGPNIEELDARRVVIEAALSHLNEAKAKDKQESARRSMKT